ncbi:MAG: flagellar export chaperone FlgN [Candidatus Adiutrix sp.]
MDIILIENLCKILKSHLKRYETLVDFIEKEKKYLLNLDLDGMFSSSQAKEQLALDIQKNINVLVEAIREVAFSLGLNLEPQPLLADLVRKLPKPYDNEVNDASIQLVRLKNIILRENEANRHFIEEAMRLANESINILTGANQLKGDGYTKDGVKGEKKRTLPVKLSKEV